jgi:hypothetical protein
MASWDRAPKEPKSSYGRFTVHRDFGPNRSLTETAQITGVSYGVIRQESSAWNWTERCDQFDAHVESLSRRAYVTELEKQARLRARAYNELMAKCLKQIPTAPQGRVGEIATAMKVAADGMRMEAGLATAKIDVEDVTPLTDDERMRRLEALAAAAEARGGVAVDDPGGTGGGRPAPRGVAVH